MWYYCLWVLVVLIILLSGFMVFSQYKQIKAQIKLKKNAVKVIIDKKSEKDRKQIDEHIELYQWKEDNYGSPHDD